MKFFTPVVLALLATASTSAAFAPAGKFTHVRVVALDPFQRFVCDISKIRILNVF
jgi:hypothetical protein